MAVDFYHPGTSRLHSFDARAKLILLVPAVACFFLPVPFWTQLPALAGFGLLIIFSLGVSELWKPLRAIGPVLILICVLTPPFTRNGVPLLSISGFPLVTSTGLQATLSTVTRFAGITLAFVAVFRSMEPEHLALALQWFGAPYTMALTFMLALRYIPSLGATWRNVQDAHKLRVAPRAPLGREPPGRPRSARALPARSPTRWRDSLPVLTSVLIQAVKGIPALAVALECRGFGRRAPRTSLLALKTGKGFAGDLIVCLIAAILLVAPPFLLRL
ncbi:MAG TPA: energy-coupling factor transporter transmembrane component T [Spirochaetia bacterium]|nr:energy-coupling factor transporter transmembrane component T [Spirochaetia bacterium]